MGQRSYYEQNNPKLKEVMHIGGFVNKNIKHKKNNENNNNKMTIIKNIARLAYRSSVLSDTHVNDGVFKEGSSSLLSMREIRSTIVAMVICLWYPYVFICFPRCLMSILSLVLKKASGHQYALTGD